MHNKQGVFVKTVSYSAIEALKSKRNSTEPGCPNCGFRVKMTASNIRKHSKICEDKKQLIRDLSEIVMKLSTQARRVLENIINQKYDGEMVCTSLYPN